MTAEILRETMAFDVLIVGAGPAGLSAAIRLAQLNKDRDQPLSICVLEKGAYVGAHILSGAVLEPSALEQLIPDWQTLEPPPYTEVTNDRLLLLTPNKALTMPMLPSMRNHGNVITSLGQLCQWLAQQAEQLGVNIFPSFPASALLYNEKNQVIGVQTKDMGLNKNNEPGEHFQAGMILHGKQTLLAEGCRGSLSEQVIQHFQLRQNCDPQSYAIGVKELWEIDSQQYQSGKVIHTIGWPLDDKTYGGSFIYHWGQNQLAIGLVVGLDYKNPYLDPFTELQRLKTHPKIKPLLSGGRCIEYGAKALNEGGWQCIPKLTFPGGMLLGCSAGFLNVAKIKGIHNAIHSGIIAAKTIAKDLNTDNQDIPELQSYSKHINNSTITKELQQVRNVRPAFHYGLYTGLILAGIDQYVFRGKAPWTWHYRADHLSLTPAKLSQSITYPKLEGDITADKLTQLTLSGTQHQEQQPCHLILKQPKIAIEVNYAQYHSPEQYYCPAAVYEIVEKDAKPYLQINFANCLHCKTCDIKDPTQNIQWTPPEGGDGPKYSQM